MNLETSLACITLVSIAVESDSNQIHQISLKDDFF